MAQVNNTRKELDLELANMKRNPYLVDYQDRSKRRPVKYVRKLATSFVICCVFIGVLLFILQLLESRESAESAKVFAKHPAWTEDFLTPNEYSRPGDVLEEVKSIFVHYTANQGTSAAQNRSYFEQLKDTHERSASAHFIIGYEGEIIQCIPLDEIGYAVKTRNNDSVSIECCYLEEDGSFTQETYDSLILLLRWLTDVYGLDPEEDVLRHYDCGGKKCPIYYTENEEAWKQLKKDI